VRVGLWKVCDFGLSRLLPKKGAIHDDSYRMTGETGSYVYMAPEVFRHEAYNLKVDQYAYAMILYQARVSQALIARTGAHARTHARARPRAAILTRPLAHAAPPAAPCVPRSVAARPSKASAPFQTCGRWTPPAPRAPAAGPPRSSGCRK
jgi:serine/threonine protein kinase